ncbi:MAG: hypothetical protein GX663_00545 [Clostridiales bacterium]|nr:hypothetical protein [Clostridiales bacterium]
MGKPTLLIACMTCLKKFKEHLPEIPVESLYEFIDTSQISGGCNTDDYSIFNPCTARDMQATRQAVVNIAQDMGAKLHPLEENEAYAKCCGYGGHGEIADPGYLDFVAKKRISDKSLDGQFPYITYCINCRDVFKARGKNAVHILELIYGMGNDKIPTITQRWENRLDLKETLLSLYWDEGMKKEDKMFGLTLQMSEEIKDKLNSKKIFEHEIAEVVEFCHRTGRTIENTQTGTLTGYKKVGRMTYWVEYRVADEQKEIFEVVNAYSHRLEIELEAVWNGVRKATEM